MLLSHLTPLLAAVTPTLPEAHGQPSALSSAFNVATLEGKTTMCALLVLSLFSWTIIITKARQLLIARKAAKKSAAKKGARKAPAKRKKVIPPPATPTETPVAP